MASAVPSMADDWTVIRLRGTVLELVEGAWEPLQRGDVVADDRLVRSLKGRATFQRDQEIIELSPGSVIQIMDKEGQSYTTVVNHVGTVGIDAEARNVEHFSVVTPFMAAIVKGTAFSVTTSAKSSSLEVTRGEVRMRDTAFGRELTVEAGQTASTGDVPAKVQAIGVQAPSVPNMQAPAPSSLSDGGSDSSAVAPVVDTPDTPPVTPPTTDPDNPPVEPPVTPPVTPPVEPPVTPPVTPPVEPPVTPPVQPPVTPPVTPPDPGCDDGGDEEECGDD
jgi:hypothetical protein